MSDPSERLREPRTEAPPPPWLLRLYVAGQSPKSMLAVMNLKRLCALHVVGDYSIEVIDLIEHPHLAARDQVLAIPTLVRIQPPPVRKLVGDLSETDRVVANLELPPGRTEADDDRPR